MIACVNLSPSFLQQKHHNIRKGIFQISISISDYQISVVTVYTSNWQNKIYLGAGDLA